VLKWWYYNWLIICRQFMKQYCWSHNHRQRPQECFADLRSQIVCFCRGWKQWPSNYTGDSFLDLRRSIANFRRYANRCWLFLIDSSISPFNKKAMTYIYKSKTTINGFLRFFFPIKFHWLPKNPSFLPSQKWSIQSATSQVEWPC
jgi:hypothetical protein